jgi:hypothetical protein
VKFVLENSQLAILKDVRHWTSAISDLDYDPELG